MTNLPHAISANDSNDWDKTCYLTADSTVWLAYLSFPLLRLLNKPTPLLSHLLLSPENIFFHFHKNFTLILDLVPKPFLTPSVMHNHDHNHNRNYA